MVRGKDPHEYATFPDSDRSLLLSISAIGAEPIKLPAVEGRIVRIELSGKIAPGNNSIANGAPDSWAGFKKKFGYETDEEALKTKESPIDLLKPLANAGVPILLVCGDKDPAVPYEENDAVMEERYKKLGGEITVIVEDKGHSHGMKDPTRVLEFIRKHTADQASSE